MAEAAQAETTQETQDQVHSSQEMENVDKIGTEVPEAEFKPLFEDEIEEEAEQEGTDEDTKEESKEDGDTPTDPKEETATDQPKDGEKPDAEDKPKDGEKPPAGMVPIAALHEERNKRQSLSTEVQTLRAQLAAKKAGLPENGEDAGVPKGFKVLSDDEFSELAEDDPGAAVIYQRHLQKHVEVTTSKDMQERAEKDTIDRTYAEMEKVVPGIFDKEGDANETLSAFAAESGLDDMNVLATITNPGTKFIDADGNALLLGEGAAKVLSLIASAHQKSKGTDQTALRKQIEKEVTANLMKKFKTPDSGDSHASIGDIPGDSGQDIEMRDYSESELMNLSASDRRRWLGG